MSISENERLLQVIDILRGRKARPDLPAIEHMMVRKFGVPKPRVREIMTMLLNQNKIIKVDYKGNASYRNASKWAGRRHRDHQLSGQVMNSSEVSSALVGAVKVLTKRKKGEAGVSADEVEAYLKEINSKKVPPETLRTALEREVAYGSSLRRLSGLLFALVPKKDGKEKENMGDPKRDAKERDNMGDAKKGQKENIAEGTLHKAKRIKKFHGPDFVETCSLNSLDYLDGDDPVCDFCLMPATSNPEGETEPLLVCKDCGAKAHPSCMDYSPELARKSQLFPWQCMACKICAVCHDPENGECMLFCDSCDKGYHVSCHKPKIVGKPNGKWVCYQCNEETAEKTSQIKINSSLPIKKSPSLDDSVNNVGLPTPCDSALSDSDASDDSEHKPIASLLKDSMLSQYPQKIPDAKDWTIEDVEKFFTSVGFPEQAPAFKDQEIDGKSLLLLKRSDVLTGMSLRLGPALKIYNHIKRLQSGLP